MLERRRWRWRHDLQNSRDMKFGGHVFCTHTPLIVMVYEYERMGGYGNSLLYVRKKRAAISSEGTHFCSSQITADWLAIFFYYHLSFASFVFVCRSLLELPCHWPLHPSSVEWFGLSMFQFVICSWFWVRYKSVTLCKILFAQKQRLEWCLKYSI